MWLQTPPFEGKDYSSEASFNHYRMDNVWVDHPLGDMYRGDCQPHSLGQTKEQPLLVYKSCVFSEFCYYFSISFLHCYNKMNC